MIYIFILLAKIVEVSMMTIRVVLITRGERKIGAIIAFFEVVIWVMLVSTVLTNITEDPFKVIVYALGFAIGNYTGSMLEEKIGIGLSEVHVIVKDIHGYELAKILRDKGYAVTLVHGEGRKLNRHILFTFVPRKQVKQVVQLIRENQENAVITVSERKPVYGGFGMLRK